MKNSWEDVVILLNGRGGAGKLIETILCDSADFIDIPDIFHRLCCTSENIIPLLLSTDWTVRENAGITLELLCRKHAVWIVDGLSMSESDGVLLNSLNDCEDE